MPNRFSILILLLAALATACSSRRGSEPSPEVYREAVTAFYVGVSAMQTSQEVLAREKLDRVVALVPQEPAGWADLGLLLLRQQDLEQGAQQLARAASLAPDIAEIQKLQALAESRRGNLPEALAHWQRALALDPSDRQAAYALALDTEREGGPENDAARNACSSSSSRAATTWSRVSNTHGSRRSAETRQRSTRRLRR